MILHNADYEQIYIGGIFFDVSVKWFGKSRN